MSISSISSNAATGTGSSPAIAPSPQRRQEFKSLVTALKSGDLSAARSAYQALTGGQASSTTSSPSSTPSATNPANTSKIDPNSPLGQLGQALASGDLPAAKQALQAIEAKRDARPHFHRNTVSPVPAAPTPDASAGSAGSDAASATGAPGSVINVAV